jgi:hypothetical protein
MNCVVRISFLLFLLQQHSVAQSQDWLYGVRGITPFGYQLERMNISTGNEMWSKILPGFAWGMTWNGNRFLSIDIIPQNAPDKVLAIHPADAATIVAGTTGLNNNTGIQSIEASPVTGIVYYSEYSSLYTIDVYDGGGLSLVSLFSGFAVSGDGITALAIDASGNAFGLGTGLGNQTNIAYSIDLATAVVTMVGTVPIGGHGWFRDFAIANNGQWYASFYDTGLFPATRGLYRIDPSAGYAATLLRQVPDPHFGLAFLPATSQTTYCTAKVNSLGCTPAITGTGFPSPSAASGYEIRATNVRNQVVGSLVYGVSGQASTPFGGGSLCIAAPWARTALVGSGGTPLPAADCTGTWHMDFNAWMGSSIALPAGTAVQCQWLGRDPGFAPPNAWTLSNGLQFTTRP